MATGPRTSQGKNQSKYNAVTHGIFSKVFLLKDESEAEFDSLLDGLGDYFQPEGTLEETLVEKLATLFWRYRRLLIAESAEVQKEIEESAPPSLSGNTGNKGLIQNIGDPGILEQCRELLFELRQSVDRRGFEDSDCEILRKIYGTEATTPDTVTLFDKYIACLNVSKTVHGDESFSAPKECLAIAVRHIDAEIVRLGDRTKHTAAPRANLEVEVLRHNVPESPAADRLNKYEASLERAIDRTLKQLERVQRIRLGLPVTPSVDVNISP